MIMVENSIHLCIHRQHLIQQKQDQSLTMAIANQYNTLLLKSRNIIQSFARLNWFRKAFKVQSRLEILKCFTKDKFSQMNS